MKMFFCGIDFVSLLFVSNTFVLDYFWEKPGTLLLNTSHKLPAYSMYICLLLSWHKQRKKICGKILMSHYPVFHFKRCTCEDESGRTGMQPYQQTARKITETQAKDFYHTAKYRGKKQAVIQRDKLERERQTGRKTERQAETNRQCSSLVW